jgi:trehalose/maltose hydrolase-like predicted phosphorylase
VPTSLDATAQYIAATGDEQFETECVVELLVETARLCASLGHHHTSAEFRIDGVTGPDEYSALADNNLFTNLMAQQSLRDAADACCRHADVARRLQVTDDEATYWRDCADHHMMVPYNTELGVHGQAENFTHQSVWDFAATPAHPLSAAAGITHTLSCTANRSSNRPTSPWRCTCAVTPSSLSACAQAVRPPRSVTYGWPSTI